MYLFSVFDFGGSNTGDCVESGLNVNNTKDADLRRYSSLIVVKNRIYVDPVFILLIVCQSLFMADTLPIKKIINPAKAMPAIIPTVHSIADDTTFAPITNSAINAMMARIPITINIYLNAFIFICFYSKLLTR